MGTVANGGDGLGPALRRRRLQLGLTQEELAARSGMSVRAISDIERGRTPRPRRSSESLLASALGLRQPGPADLAAALAPAHERVTPEAAGAPIGPADAPRRNADLPRGMPGAHRGLPGGVAYVPGGGRVSRPGGDAEPPRDDADRPYGDAEPPRDDADRPYGTAGSAPDLILPRQLPTMTPDFVGRSAELSALTRLAENADDERRETAIVAAISGAAGVGKTALAVRWAQQVASRFPDGQLYIDLRGFGPASPAAPAEAICGFLEALGVPPERIPAQPDARTGLYRSLLAGKRMLVVLDNASDADQVRPLLPGARGCLALVTSRSQLTSLAVAAGARLVPLDVLSQAEARDLLALRLGADRLAGEPDAVDALVELTAGLPLALSIAAARASAHPAHPLAALMAELQDTRGRLEALDAGDASADVRAAISWSYRRLSAPAARMFRLLGLHPGPDVTVAAAASLAGGTQRAARRALAELMAGGLVTEPAPGRHACHDLTRAYAAELGQECDPGVARRAAAARMLDHYLHTANAGMHLIHAVSERLPLEPPVPGVRQEDLRTIAQAIAWFTAERDVLLAMTAIAARSGFDRHACLLPATLASFLHRRGHWHDWAASQRIALAAAQRLGDQQAQALVHRRLGQALTLLGNQDAYTHLGGSIRIFWHIGDRIGLAYAHSAMAVFLDVQRHDYGASLSHARRALRLFEEAGHRLGRALALNHMGWDHIQLGDQEQALACCQEALLLYREAADRTLTGDTLDSMGLAYLKLGRLTEAIGCYRQAIGEYRTAGHRAGEGLSIAALGDVQQASGDLAAAATSWRQAIDVLGELSHPDAESVRAKLQASG